MLIAVQRLDPTAKVAHDIPGKSCTFELPDQVVALSIWSTIIAWLRENPEIILMILTALAGLFSILPPLQKTLEKSDPPTK